MPIFGNKLVSKLMHFEDDYAENVATQRYIKTIDFYLHESDKGICDSDVTTASRQPWAYWS